MCAHDGRWRQGCAGLRTGAVAGGMLAQRGGGRKGILAVRGGSRARLGASDRARTGADEGEKALDTSLRQA